MGIVLANSRLSTQSAGDFQRGVDTCWIPLESEPRNAGRLPIVAGIVDLAGKRKQQLRDLGSDES